MRKGKETELSRFTAQVEGKGILEVTYPEGKEEKAAVGFLNTLGTDDRFRTMTCTEAMAEALRKATDEKGAVVTLDLVKYEVRNNEGRSTGSGAGDSEGPVSRDGVVTESTPEAS